MNEVRAKYKTIDNLAKVILDTYDSLDLKNKSMWVLAAEYELGKLGNLPFHSAMKASVRSYGFITNSEVSDMIMEFEEEDLVVIDNY